MKNKKTLNSGIINFDIIPKNINKIVNKIVNKYNNYIYKKITTNDYEILVEHLNSIPKDKVDEFCDWMRKVTYSDFLNTPDHRMNKGTIIGEKFCDVFNLQYGERIGYDASFNKKKISIKTQMNLCQKKAQKTKPIILANSLGDNNFDKTFNIDFDYLICIDSTQCGIFVALKENLNLGKDNCKASQTTISIPFKCMNVIKEPNYKLISDKSNENFEKVE